MGHHLRSLFGVLALALSSSLASPAIIKFLAPQRVCQMRQIDGSTWLVDGQVRANNKVTYARYLGQFRARKQAWRSCQQWLDWGPRRQQKPHVLKRKSKR